jgi:hypothetical protein
MSYHYYKNLQFVYKIYLFGIEGEILTESRKYGINSTIYFVVLECISFVLVGI